MDKIKMKTRKASELHKVYQKIRHCTGCGHTIQKCWQGWPLTLGCFDMKETLQNRVTRRQRMAARFGVFLSTNFRNILSQTYCQRPIGCTDKVKTIPTWLRTLVVSPAVFTGSLGLPTDIGLGVCFPLIADIKVDWSAYLPELFVDLAPLEGET